LIEKVQRITEDFKPNLSFSMSKLQKHKGMRIDNFIFSESRNTQLQNKVEDPIPGNSIRTNSNLNKSISHIELDSKSQEERKEHTKHDSLKPSHYAKNSIKSTPQDSKAHLDSNTKVSMDRAQNSTHRSKRSVFSRRDEKAAETGRKILALSLQHLTSVMNEIFINMTKVTQLKFL